MKKPTLGGSILSRFREFPCFLRSLTMGRFLWVSSWTFCQAPQTRFQAYIQAKLKGPLCWVELPTDAWPPEIQYWKFRRPVVRLDKALYGHPDSGTMWEQHCDKKVQEIGFKPIGGEWPSMYFHDELKLLLVIYVDDLKLAGPSENLAKGWEMLRTVLRIEPETDLGLYSWIVCFPKARPNSIMERKSRP